MYKYFADIPFDNEEMLSEERVKNIKTSVLSRIKKEERSMKKSTAIKTLSIAAVAAATAMMSAMIASAELPQTPAPAQETDADETSGWVIVTEADENISEAPDNTAAEVSEDSDWVKETDAKDEETNPEPNKAVDPESPDYFTVLYDEEWDVYYYYRVPEEMMDVVPGETIYVDGDPILIYKNEVLVDPQELTYKDGKIVYTPKS